MSHLASCTLLGLTYESVEELHDLKMREVWDNANLIYHGYYCVPACYWTSFVVCHWLSDIWHRVNLIYYILSYVLACYWLKIRHVPSYLTLYHFIHSRFRYSARQQRVACSGSASAYWWRSLPLTHTWPSICNR